MKTTWDEVREFLVDSDSNDKDEKQEFVFYRGGRGPTCLHVACCRHPPDDIIKSLLDIGGLGLVMMKDDNWWEYTALHYACCKGASLNAIKMLIDLGGRELIMAKDLDDYTALYSLCEYSNGTHDSNVANKIKLMIEVAGAETILTEKSTDSEIPLDLAEVHSDEIKALLQPRTIKNKPANINDDSSNLVPDEHDNDNTTTELQDQLQAAEQRNADLESKIETQKTEHLKTIAYLAEIQDQQQAASQKIINQNKQLEAEREANVLLSEQNVKQGKDNTYLKGRVDNLTKLCSERKAELHELNESRRGSLVTNEKRERDEEDDYDQDNSSSRARASKRTRVVSTVNEMHVEEDDVEVVIQELLHEKQQHIHEKQQHLKLMIQLRGSGRSYEVQRRNWISRM